jgi:hypothetical protein
MSTPDTKTYSTLSERRFYVTLTGVRGGAFGGDIGPAIVTVHVSQRDGVAPSGGSFTPSYAVRDHHGAQMFGGVAAHLPTSGCPTGGGMIWHAEVAPAIEPLGTEGCIVLPGIDGPTLWDCECASCRDLQDPSWTGEDVR